MRAHFRHLRLIDSNDISNSLIQWVLTSIIVLWRFGSPPGFELSKWKLPWECEGSFPHTFLHSRASLLACNLASLCFGREPKVRVATTSMILFCPRWFFEWLWLLFRNMWTHFSMFFFFFFFSSIFNIAFVFYISTFNVGRTICRHTSHHD